MSEAIRASIVDALLAGGSPMAIAYRHNVPLGYVAVVAAGVERRITPRVRTARAAKPKAKKRQLIKAAGC